MKVGICTLGCKVNTYESEYIVNLLKNKNYEICDFNDVCDVYIINTCTVTNNSDSKSRKMIRHARRLNSNACVIAMGCFVEACKDTIKEDMPEIDIIVGNKDKSKIDVLIDEFFLNKKTIDDTYVEFDKEFEDMYIDRYNSRTRAFVKVQDGCENFCSYCIIPKVRGKCRSKTLDTAVCEIRTLVSNGFREIVLTGIHTGNYGVDINTNFATLLREVLKIDGLKRLRISSIEITELTDEVLEIIKNSEVVVNHFHIPIQSGSDKVLKLMNRKYDINYFIDKVNKIREIKKDVSITTDIIAGHPGEDEEEFKEVLENVKKIEFSKLHVFPYSIRKNTPSEKLEQVPIEVKKIHTKKLLELSNELELKYMNKFINRKLEVLIETSKDGYSYGHTTNYLEIKVKKYLEHSKFYNVLITGVEYPYCVGEIISE
ncbi:MAG: tRNA (N(6)-L-threonylcarbamoyladenosine(37)-C(2))-methylthiotransferase MtaB [Bacilli bacterium]|nr:tRNA (N(6)-L-threonylcarbamoyladenosine(37)-C(2))-methylthiotransferase MtaB [Bacilli bacterium]